MTEAEFFVVVFELSQNEGVTGPMVERIRNDWESLAFEGRHPATPDAEAAYRQFVEQYGLLPLLDQLYPR